MKKLLLVVGVLVVVVGAAGWWFLLRGDAPERASLTATEDTAGDAGGGGDAGDGGDAAAVDPEGAWVVQPGTAEGNDVLSDEAPGSWVGYRVDEELRGLDVTAVGRTNDVSGELTYADGSVTEATFEADMTTLRSDQDRRDNAVRSQGIETDEFPTASFVLTEPIDVDVAAGEPFEAEAVGDLTLHGVTREATLTVNGQQLGDDFELVGRTGIVMADYEIEPITLAFVTTSDEGELEFKLLLSKA